MIDKIKKATIGLLSFWGLLILVTAVLFVVCYFYGWIAYNIVGWDITFIDWTQESVFSRVGEGVVAFIFSVPIFFIFYFLIILPIKMSLEDK